jgi:hypothetical protein
MMVEQNLDLEISDLTFDAFVEALWWVDLNAETPDFKNDCDFGTAYDRESCSLLSKALPDELFSPRRLTLEETLSKLNLDAWSILRIFALNPDPQDLPVTWQFADLIEGGWAPNAGKRVTGVILCDAYLLRLKVRLLELAQLRGRASNRYEQNHRCRVPSRSRYLHR